MKAIFIIALIACASAGNTFLGDYIHNMKLAQNQFNDQLTVQLELEEQAQDLAAAAAAGKVDPETVVSTINGLTDAAKFWGSFIGNEVFDKENLANKINELQSRRAQLEKYASTDGTTAMVALNQAIWDINVCIRSIQSLAKNLKSGAKNVQKITNIAFKKNQDELQGREKRLYAVGIRVLVKALETGNKNAADAQRKLDNLASQLETIQSKMTSVSQRLRFTAKGKSQEFNDWKSDMRAKVYGGCAGSILLGPAVIACYAIAAPILETEIADYKREVEAFERDFNKWASTFENLATMSGQASKVSKDWYAKVTNFKDVIVDQYDFITATQEDLEIDSILREMVSEGLTELITACDKVINDSKGRLENDEQEFNAATTDAAELNVEETIQKMCKSAHPHNKKNQAKCVKTAVNKIQSM